MQIFINNIACNSLDLPTRMAYGDGIFETIRIDNHTALLLNAHVARFRDSAIFFDLVSDAFNWTEFRRTLVETAEKIPDGIIKVIMVRKQQGRGYRYCPDAGSDIIFECYEGSIPTGWQVSPADVGVSSIPCSLNAALAGHKHLNRLDSVLAAKEIQQAGWDEGLLCVAGQVFEASGANLFLLNNGEIVTPELSQAGVNGVVRREILNEFPVRVMPEISISDCINADAMFLTNAVKMIWPVNSLTVMDRIIRYDLEDPVLNRVVSCFRNRLSC